ncbi:hypothetical protein N9A67_03430 [Rhodobacteraceae bacterium]|nr:hypothetical protein [Paracoccaceae bacterium]
MNMIADALLILGAFAAAAYCLVLSRRLRNFNDLEKGIGGAVSVLSSQVETLATTLKDAQMTASQSNTSLDDLTHRAEKVSQKLELLMASMHDLPEATLTPGPPKPASQPLFSRRAKDQGGELQ